MTPGRRFKLICLVFYGGIVGGLTIVSQIRLDSAPHAEAARPILENQIISDGDLRPVGQRDISGHAALRGFAVGQKITTRDVSEPTTPAVDNTVAAVITIRIPTGGAGIEKGASIQLCLDRKPLGKPSKVAMAICGSKNCLVTIPLTEWPADTTGAKGPENTKSTKAKGKNAAKRNTAQDAKAGAQSAPLPMQPNRLSGVPEGEKCDGG